MRPLSFVAALIVSLSACLMAQAQDKADQKLFDKVMNRLLATDPVIDDYPKKYFWPPRYFIKPDSQREVNAYATAARILGAEEKSGKIQPIVMMTQGFLKEVVKGDENLMAAVMGHELAHVLKDHVGNRPGETPLLLLAFSRDHEIEADVQGMRYAVAAGYPYKAAIAGAVRGMRTTSKFSSFEGLSATHPSWDERLALLDRERAHLWKAMTAFSNGLFFLEVEQYLSAQQCFRAVTKEFPDCHEAWANLGYALLMQYCDGLDADDLRRFDIGQVVSGAFYLRPESLEARVRGVDDKLWRDAVKALDKALALDSSLALPRANLGLAYLVHPDGKDVERADKYFQEALSHFRKDPEIKKNSMAVAAVMLNAAVADLARGRHAEAGKKLDAARKLAGLVKGAAQGRALLDALQYNEALIHGVAGEKRKSHEVWEDYLLEASPDAAWWTVAQQRYLRLSKELDVEPLTELASKRRPRPVDPLRMVSSIKVGSQTVTLSEPLQQAVEQLGEKNGVAVPLFPGSKLVRWRFKERGVDLLGKEKILGIFLTSADAPPLVLQGSGVAGKTWPIQVGMEESAIERILKNQMADLVPRALADRAVTYRFYPELGLGVRIVDGRVRELALAQLPRRALFGEVKR